MAPVFERWGLATGEGGTGETRAAGCCRKAILSLTTTLTVAVPVREGEGRHMLGRTVKSYDAVAANSLAVDLSDVVAGEREREECISL